MTADEHYMEAEQLLEDGKRLEPMEAAVSLLAALVHAVLAQA